MGVWALVMGFLARGPEWSLLFDRHRASATSGMRSRFQNMTPPHALAEYRGEDSPDMCIRGHVIPGAALATLFFAVCSDVVLVLISLHSTGLLALLRPTACAVME
jgi:hypothetical protein